MTIHPLDLFEAGLHGRARRDLASGELPGQFGNRQLINHAVYRPNAGTVGEPPPKGKVKTSPLRANKRVATIALCRGICLALDLRSPVFRR